MIEIRPCTDDAAAALSLSLFNETLPQRAATLEESRSYLAEMIDFLDCVALLDGAPAGSGLVSIQPWQRESDIAHAMLAVPPRNRRRGVGGTLFAALGAWALERGRRQMEAWTYDDDPAGRDFALARGFVEVVRDARVALETSSVERPSVDTPPGIEIVTWAERPELGPALYEVASECNPDIPGNEDETMPPLEDWLAHDMGGPSDKPEATFVALAGDEAVGYAKFHLQAARPTVALHDLTAVKRAWRGRGIARALKQTQIAWAKEHGYERLETANEVRNEPIRRLNEQLGYRSIPGRALMRGPSQGSFDAQAAASA